MTKTENKQSCPTCRQSVNKRYITLNKSMVKSLASVMKWCRKEDRHEFSRKEIKHLFKTESETAHFGNWVHFGGIFYKKAKGSWGINMPRAITFMRGYGKITTSVIHDPLAGTYEAVEWGRIDSVKGIAASIDDAGDYVVEYQKAEPVKLPPKVKDCEECNGSGVVNFMAGLKTVPVQCTPCWGKGKITL